MVYLAERGDDHPVPLSAIARSESIPTAFLERILGELRSAGLVLTARGVSGGYRLARSAEEISVADVVDALEGPRPLVDCVPDENGCERSESCRSRLVWQRLDDAVSGALSGITLAELKVEATAR